MELDTVHKRWHTPKGETLTVLKQPPKAKVAHQLVAMGGGAAWCRACRAVFDDAAKAVASCSGMLVQRFTSAAEQHKAEGQRQHTLRRLTCLEGDDEPTVPVAVCTTCGALGSRRSRLLMQPCHGPARKRTDGWKTLVALDKDKLLRRDTKVKMRPFL